MAADDDGIWINGKHYSFLKLDLNELAELELHTGKTQSEMDFGSAQVMRFMIYLLMRRDNPQVTVEQAGEITMEALAAAGERPTEAVAAGEVAAASS